MKPPPRLAQGGRVLALMRLAGVVVFALLVARREATRLDEDAGDRVLGYAGPTRLHLSMDEQERVAAAEIQSSADTPSYVRRLQNDGVFLPSLLGLSHADLLQWQPDAVTGATLTSRAVVGGLRARLSGKVDPGPFAALTADALHQAAPLAASLEPDRRPVHALLDAQGRRLGAVLRGAVLPKAGYRGPTDAVLLLDIDGISTELLLLESFESPRWIEDVRMDRAYAALFRGLDLQQVAALRAGAEGIEGVSGATMTSQSVVTALARAAQQALAPPPPSAPRTWRELLGWMVGGGAALLLAGPLRRRRRWRAALRISVMLGLGAGAGALLSLDSASRWMSHGLPWQAAPLLAGMALVALCGPALSGRKVYCRSLCAHGAAQQLLARGAPWQMPAQLDRHLRRLPGALLLAAAILVALPPAWLADSSSEAPSVKLGDAGLVAWEPFSAWIPSSAPALALVLAALSLLLAARLPLAYCHYGCPTGRLLEFVRWRRDRSALRDRRDRRALPVLRELRPTDLVLVLVLVLAAQT